MKTRTRKPRRKALPGLPQTILTAAQLSGMSPLDYMLAVMRDESADVARRDRMAIAAAQYLHPRAADYRKGKKDVEAEAAKKAGVDSGWADDLDYADGHRPQ